MVLEELVGNAHTPQIVGVDERGKHHGFFLQVVLSHFRVKEVADSPQLFFITALESVFLDALDQHFECIEVSVNARVGVVQKFKQGLVWVFHGGGMFIDCC